MRRGYDGSTWRDENGKLIAVNLGADHCAEHEWGIKGIQKGLGIQGSPTIDFYKSSLSSLKDAIFGGENQKTGIEARKMTSINEDYIIEISNLKSKGVTVKSYQKGKTITHKMWGFSFRQSFFNDEETDWKNVCGGYYTPEREEVCGKWSSSGFSFLTEDKSVIVDIKDAFERNDIAIWVGSSGPFKNGGLIIAIPSKIPEDFIRSMKDDDEDRLNLLNEVKKTGIHIKLKNAGKKFYGLSPSWKDKLKNDIVFWLNPTDQHIYNSGWYTVQDLNDWINDEGPVVKKD